MRPASVRTPTSRTGTHVASLEGLRGVAIAAVVVFHATVMATRGASWAGDVSPPIGLWPIFAGKLGVDVFFVLSGFLVYRSWQHLRRRYDGSAPATLFEFGRRRARRIVPPYWFSLAVFIPMRAPEWLLSWDGWSNVLMFASGQQFLSPELPHRINAVTWSLTTEIHFYLLLPLLALSFARSGWPRVLAALIACTIVWRVLAGGTGDQAEWIFGRADQFAAGMAASAIVAEHARGRTSAVLRLVRARAAGWVMVLGLLFIAVPLAATQLLPQPMAFQATFHVFAGLLIAAFIIRLVTTDRRSLLENRVLCGLGACSYSLYLWHWPLMMEATKRWGNDLTVIAGALAVTAVMTYISYRFFEKPLVRTVPTSTPAYAEARVPIAAAHR
jgi:peptidoglycan/LPS O-acetylase OafA/YrhL